MLPIINLNTVDETCIYSTLMFIQDQSEKHNKSIPCLTFDQPLWLKATKIYLRKGASYRLLIRRFSHLLMKDTMTKSSGLAESFETRYGEPTVCHMFAVKAVSRALRGHFLVGAVLMTSLLRHLFPTDYIYFQEADELLTD